jgi:hypothetical protein
MQKLAMNATRLNNMISVFTGTKQSADKVFAIESRFYVGRQIERGRSPISARITDVAQDVWQAHFGLGASSSRLFGSEAASGCGRVKGIFR